MKKILSLIMAAAVLISASGCTKYDSSSSSSPADSYKDNSSMSSKADEMKDNLKNGMDNMENMNPMKRKAEDGTYRGAFVNPTEMDVTFVIKDNKFQKIDFNTAYYANGAAMENYREIADYLIGKDIDDIKSVYEPWNIIKDMDKNKIEGGKLVSALNDGINRGVLIPFGAEENKNISQIPDDSSDMPSSENENSEKPDMSEN